MRILSPVSVAAGQTQDRAWLLFGLIGLASAIAWPTSAETIRLLPPTDNDALLSGELADFYMGTDRDGIRVWQGGMFGFTRAPLHWPGGVAMTQFHEGIDIAPVRRVGNAPPDDDVRAIADGVVVLCELEGRTRYGRQVILRHDWAGPITSRYAHLRSVGVKIGQRVTQGQRLGALGNSGGGIPMERAHLHLEVNLMLHAKFARSWLPRLAEPMPEPTFHPANLAGVDPAALLVAAHQESGVDFVDFVKTLPAYFKVEFAAAEGLDILLRYPWLADQTDGASGAASGWRVSFTTWGLPVAFEAISHPPAQPAVIWVRPYDGKHAWSTGGILSGTGERAVLGPAGEALISILLGRPPMVR